jgi:hypothetical protein
VSNEAKLLTGVTSAIATLQSSADAASFDLDEAYLTYSDSARSPVYVKIGKTFSSYGNYSDPYTPTPSFSQLFNQTTVTAIELGVNEPNSDWSASAWAYDSEQTANKGFDKFGARVGFHSTYQNVGMNFNASMLNDARTLQPDSGLKPNFMKDFSSSAPKREMALNAHLGLNYQDMSAYADYTTVAGTLGDAKFAGTAAKTTYTDSTNTTLAKGEPTIYSFGLGYKFNTAGRKQSLAVGYEFTDADGKAVFYGKNHWSAAYTADLSKNFQGYVAYDHYKMHDGNGSAWYEATDSNATGGGVFSQDLKGNKFSVLTVGFKAHM